MTLSYDTSIELIFYQQHGTTWVMRKTPQLTLPDDEYYYFGVELSDSPEDVRERLLRKPEYLYSIHYHEVDDEEEYTTWLYLWRGNEGWEGSAGELPFEEQIAQMRARHNMGLHVVLYALTEGEMLQPGTSCDREPHRYILVEPVSAEGSRTVPQLNLLRATGNTELTRFHVTKATLLPELFEGAILESLEPEEVPQEVIDRHCLMYARRALSVMNAIHDADSMALLLPHSDEFFRFSSHLLMRSKHAEEFHNIHSQLGEKMFELLLQPWYAGCRHQCYMHPSGLVLCETYPSEGKKYKLELLDFEPGRQLCYRHHQDGISRQIIPAGEGDTPFPQRDGGRFHILPDDSQCGIWRDAHGRIIRTVSM